MNDHSEYIILIVDDNPKNLQLLGSILKEDGYKVEFATNGREAVEWLDEKPFDLVLLDIMMPVIDGYETCRIIRKKPEYNDMPVIFLTAKTAKESIVKGLESGAQDFITKPFDKNELLARVATHLELRYSKLQLLEVNRWLEEKVAERTKELEEANRQLSNLDEAKTEFLNLIGHEIRTPLNGILGPMQLLRTEKHGSELDLMLGLMEASVDRLEKFALQALLITRLRTGRQKVNFDNSDLKDVFVKIGADIDSLLKKSKTKLIVNIDGPVIARVDKYLIGLCFEKLIENTLQFISTDGELIVEAKVEKSYINVFISDKRIKFSDKFLDGMYKLFEPAGEYSDSNLGIGMVLVNLILTSHNAEIVMKNKEKTGASIEIKIPNLN
jgi:two-component system sensor histidine kinase/response regulator